MNWNKYTIRTTVDAEDIIAAILMEHGVEGVEICDAMPPSQSELEAMYVDSATDLLPDNWPPTADASAAINFYLRIAEDVAQEDNRVHGADAFKEVRTINTGSCVDDSYTIHDIVWTQAQADELLRNLRDKLDALSKEMDIGSAIIETEISREEDWRDNWKDYYKPIQINNLLIVPAWEDVSQTSDELTIIRINPGNAFGTGSHATTKLSADALSRFVREGDTVLDIGTGSGILGLVALKQGASLVLATEIDPACEHIVYDNLELNGIEKNQFKLHIGNILEDDNLTSAIRQDEPDGFDIVVANILSPVIIELASEGMVDSFVKQDGIFIATGIIDTAEDVVVAAVRSNPNWEIVETNRLGEWVCIVAKSRECTLS